jgi:flagellar motor switch protein FliG
MTGPEQQLTGIEKASVLLMSLGPDASEQVMSRLSPEQRDVLGAQIVRMRSVTGMPKDKSAVRTRVLDEVRRHCRFALLDAQFDARPVSDRGGSPFKWLEACEPDKVTRMLSGERPRTVALVLSYLSPGLVASVMERLDDRVRDRVARSLAEGCPTSDEVVRTIDETMRDRALHPDDKHRPSEVLSILSALGDATSKARESVLAAVLRPHPAATPPRLAELSSLEDLSQLPDWRTRALLGGVDLDDLCLALRVASNELKTAVLRNVPPATAALLREQLESTGQVRIREIEIAQQRVLAVVMRAFASQPGPELDSGDPGPNPELVQNPPHSPLSKGGMRGVVEGEASVE